jgi:uncharacterized membrane protein
LLSEPFRFSEMAGTVGLGIANPMFNAAKLVSLDGSTVVGQSDATHAFRWTSDRGIEDLGALPDSIGTIALDVSEDGGVIVGASRVSGGATARALRWTSAGLVPLIADTATTSVAMLVRGGGSVILGTTAVTIFRLTEAGGVELFHSLAGDGSDFYELGGANADGSIFTGTRSPAGGAGEVFRYTAAAGMIGLEPLATYTQCGAVGMSSSGNVIVGYCDRVVDGVLDSEQAFRWTESTGMVGLGALPNDPFSFPTCMSADGSVIVGNSGINAEAADSFIWDPTSGTRALGSLFEDDPVTKSGWTIDRGACVSADGHVVFGEMKQNGSEIRAWVARLPARFQSPP